MQDKQIIIQTDRLILRRYCKDDLRDLFEYLSDAEVIKYEPYKPMSLMEAREELDKRIANKEMIAVVLKTTNKLIGNLYLGKREFESLEIGYVFNKQYWGQGYARESCDALIKKAFSEGIHRIFAECDPCNSASWRLLESLGFVREAHFQQNVFFWKDDNGNPIWKDTFVYSILNKQAGASNLQVHRWRSILQTYSPVVVFSAVFYCCLSLYFPWHSMSYISSAVLVIW